MTRFCDISCCHDAVAELCPELADIPPGLGILWDKALHGHLKCEHCQQGSSAALHHDMSSALPPPPQILCLGNVWGCPQSGLCAQSTDPIAQSKALGVPTPHAILESLDR